jgi:hypothetical protein
VTTEPDSRKGEGWTTTSVVCAVCSQRWTAVIEGRWGDGEGDALQCPSCRAYAGFEVEEME